MSWLTTFHVSHKSKSLPLTIVLSTFTATSSITESEDQRKKPKEQHREASHKMIPLDELIDYNEANFPSAKSNKVFKEKIKIDLKQKKVWGMRFNELKQFKRDHGHLSVPKTGSKYITLTRWIRTQKRAYVCRNEGKPCTNKMTDERVKKLEDIGFTWSCWDKKFEDLLRFKKKYGHCDVPQRSKLYPSLGNWVSKQRLVYRSYYEEGISVGKYTADRIKKLESIGFNWGYLTAKERDI